MFSISLDYWHFLYADSHIAVLLLNQTKAVRITFLTGLHDTVVKTPVSADIFSMLVFPLVLAMMEIFQKNLEQEKATKTGTGWEIDRENRQDRLQQHQYGTYFISYFLLVFNIIP